MALKAEQRLRQISTMLTSKKLLDVAYPVFLKNTPIDTGNARYRTFKTETQIVASYPYAKRLNEGYSRQSPKGMVNPTIIALRAYIKKILG
jgi:hypothetical protein